MAEKLARDILIPGCLWPRTFEGPSNPDWRPSRVPDPGSADSHAVWWSGTEIGDPQ